ncbi:hypothetical protein HGM15179_020795, partial [Zosterops borbonicus]
MSGNSAPENETAVTEYILKGFPELEPRLQLFFSQVFLFIYLTTVMGNATIIFLVCGSPPANPHGLFHLHIKSSVMLISGQNTLSLSSCFAQKYFYFALGCTEFVLLVVMSFDCCVAICHPLLCAAIMKPQLCVHLGVAVWVLSFVSFYGSKIPHFLCDNSPLFKLSSSDT